MGDGVKKPSSYKEMAKEAKQRMKSGYWKDFDRELNEKVDAASLDGTNPSKVADYYVNKTIGAVNGKHPLSDEFYLKVCRFLDEYGEAGDAIGRLIDHEVYDGLNYEQKQRYVLELSGKYLEALERYRKEKEFGGANARNA
ncbi:MAG: hypothetical protein J6U35_03190 [Clostridia bacterium]|nr:hypothetical protein [Clostridia bacterium]